jgi:hypothetical protein
MTLDERLAVECAHWVAQQMSEEFGGFLPGEIVEGILELEQTIRDQLADPALDHDSMARRLLAQLAEDGIPVGGYGQINLELLIEMLHWEDEFLGLAGQPRTTR